MIERDGISVIPVARLIAGFGAGMGGGRGEEPKVEAGLGVGGGGGFFVSPLGTLDVRADAVSFRPLAKRSLLRRTVAGTLRFVKRAVLGAD